MRNLIVKIALAMREYGTARTVRRAPCNGIFIVDGKTAYSARCPTSCAAFFPAAVQCAHRYDEFARVDPRVDIHDVQDSPATSRIVAPMTMHRWALGGIILVARLYKVLFISPRRGSAHVLRCNAVVMLCYCSS